MLRSKKKRIESVQRRGWASTARIGLTLATLGWLSACGSGSSAVHAPNGTEVGLFSPATSRANFRLSLTDAPNSDVRSVYVNVSRIELRLAGKGKEAQIQVAKDFGIVDLLKLRDGVTLPLADLAIPNDVQIKQLRFVLKEGGNYVLKNDGSRCDLQTPSQQQSGLKLLVKDSVTVSDGYKYSVVVDFDALKSLVWQGNGGCLLKPVLKVKSIARVAIQDEDKDGADDDGAITDPPACISGDACTGGDTDSSETPDSSGSESQAGDASSGSVGSGMDGSETSSESSTADSTADSMDVIDIADLKTYFQ